MVNQIKCKYESEFRSQNWLSGRNLLLWLWFQVAKVHLPDPDITKSAAQFSQFIWKTPYVCYSTSFMQSVTRVLTIQNNFLCFSFEWIFFLIYLELFFLFFTWLNMKMPSSSKIFSLPYCTVSSITLTLSDKFMLTIFSNCILSWATIMCIFILSGVI